MCQTPGWPSGLVRVLRAQRLELAGKSALPHRAACRKVAGTAAYADPSLPLLKQSHPPAILLLYA